MKSGIRREEPRIARGIITVDCTGNGRISAFSAKESENHCHNRTEGICFLMCLVKYPLALGSDLQRAAAELNTNMHYKIRYQSECNKRTKSESQVKTLKIQQIIKTSENSSE